MVNGSLFTGVQRMQATDFQEGAETSYDSANGFMTQTVRQQWLHSRLNLPLFKDVRIGHVRAVTESISSCLGWVVPNHLYGLLWQAVGDKVTETALSMLYFMSHANHIWISYEINSINLLIANGIRILTQYYAKIRSIKLDINIACNTADHYSWPLQGIVGIDRQMNTKSIRSITAVSNGIRTKVIIVSGFGCSLDRERDTYYRSICAFVVYWLATSDDQPSSCVASLYSVETVCWPAELSV